MMRRPPCDACRKAVAPGQGMLALDRARLTSYRRRKRMLDEEFDTTEGYSAKLVGTAEAHYGPPPAWDWGHAHCMSNAQYTLLEERFDSAEKMLWTLLLLKEKSWFDETDWRRTVAKFYPEPIPTW